MGFFISLLGALATGLKWLLDAGQRKIGREQQTNADLQKTIHQLQAEKDAAANRVSAADELFNGKF